MTKGVQKQRSQVDRLIVAPYGKLVEVEIVPPDFYSVVLVVKYLS